MTALLDSHLHLYREEFEGEEDAVLARAKSAGVRAFVHVGYTYQTNALAQREAARGVDHFATAGLHPHDAEQWSAEVAQQIDGLARAGRIVAIGECGLDYYRDLSPRPAQDRAFREQIRLAKTHDLPMVHHVRDAYPEARAVLVDEGLPARRGVFHAFAGDRDFAHWAVAEGYRLGIGGPITYKKSTLAPWIAELPLESLLLETDAPWLPPQPWRGKRNEPAYARTSAQRIADLFEVRLDELAEVQARAFEALFGVELSPGFHGATLEADPSEAPR